MSLQVSPLANVGAEVSGFDINQEIDDALKEELELFQACHENREIL